jgi:hypothetical protein
MGSGTASVQRALVPLRPGFSLRRSAGKTWRRAAEELLVRRQNAVEKSSFYVEVVHVQVELVSDGKESANSGRFRHWGVYIVGVKV